MRQDIPASHFTEQALTSLSSSFKGSGSHGATFGRAHPAYHASRVRIAFGSAPSRSIETSPSVAFGYNTPGVRFGNVTSKSSRPVSREGKTSFHFSHTFLSKTSAIRQLINEFHGGRSKAMSTAESHLLYIEREGAAEKLEVGRDQKDASTLMFERAEAKLAARDSVMQQEYLERVGAVEPVKSSEHGVYNSTPLDIASFGTIGDTPEERALFWRQANECEQNPRGEHIHIDLQDNPTMWTLLLNNVGTAPRPLSDHLRADPSSDPRSIRIRQVDTLKTLEVYKWLKALDPSFPIEIEPGRGGRVQTRIIAELPHEITPLERLEIVKSFTENLTKKQLPFWAVIHAPDANNDSRNYHVHIVYYDRPCVKREDPEIPGSLVWDFTIRDEIVYASRNRRMGNPYVQPKLRETTKSAWISALRKAWEQSCNKTLEKAGADKRYDSRTYKEMGINLDPLKHIPSKTFNKERRGEITIEGVDLARRQWGVLLETVANKNALRTHNRVERVNAHFGQVMKALELNAPHKKQDIKEAEKLHGLARFHARAIGLAELMQDVARLTIDRVASRARLVYYGFIETPVKSRGRPRKSPPLTSQNGLTPEAREASRFLETLLARALQIDSQNTREVTIARGQFAVVTRRLDEIAQNTSQKRNTPKTRASERVESLTPTAESRRLKNERMAQRIQQTLVAIRRAAEPAKETKQSTTPAPSPSRGAVPNQKPAPAKGKRKNTGRSKPVRASKGQKHQKEASNGERPARSDRRSPLWDTDTPPLTRKVGSKPAKAPHELKPAASTGAVPKPRQAQVPSAGPRNPEGSGSDRLRTAARSIAGRDLTTPATRSRTGTAQVQPTPSKQTAETSTHKPGSTTSAMPQVSSKAAPLPVRTIPVTRAASSNNQPATAKSAGPQTADRGSNRSPAMPGQASTSRNKENLPKTPQTKPSRGTPASKPLGPSSPPVTVDEASIVFGHKRDLPSTITVGSPPSAQRTTATSTKSATEVRERRTGIQTEPEEKKVTAARSTPNDANNEAHATDALPVRVIPKRKPRRRDDGYGR